MKNDKYLRFILTVIAVCLLWICIRDIRIGPSSLFANSDSAQSNVWVDGGELDVRIIGTTANAFYGAEPISVEIWAPQSSE